MITLAKAPPSGLNFGSHDRPRYSRIKSTMSTRHWSKIMFSKVTLGTSCQSGGWFILWCVDLPRSTPLEPEHSEGKAPKRSTEQGLAWQHTRSGLASHWAGCGERPRTEINRKCGQIYRAGHPYDASWEQRWWWCKPSDWESADTSQYVLKQVVVVAQLTWAIDIYRCPGPEVHQSSRRLLLSRHTDRPILDKFFSTQSQSVFSNNTPFAFYKIYLGTSHRLVSRCTQHVM